MTTSTSATPRNAGKPFSDRAVGFLESNAGVLSAKSIAGRLGRTVKAVHRKAQKLGLSLSVG
jgi:hypothetical protein